MHALERRRFGAGSSSTKGPCADASSCGAVSSCIFTAVTDGAVGGVPAGAAPGTHTPGFSQFFPPTSTIVVVRDNPTILQSVIGKNSVCGEFLHKPLAPLTVVELLC